MHKIPEEVREMVGFAADEDVPDDRIRFAHKENLSRGAAWDQCKMPRNPWRKAHTENYWAWFSLEELDTADLVRWVEKQIHVIEVDARYQDEPATVQVNAPLAMIQISLKARLQVLQQIQILLKAGGH